MNTCTTITLSEPEWSRTAAPRWLARPLPCGRHPSPAHVEGEAVTVNHLRIANYRPHFLNRVPTAAEIQRDCNALPPDPPPNSAPLHDYTPPVVPAKVLGCAVAYWDPQGGRRATVHVGGTSVAGYPILRWWIWATARRLSKSSDTCTTGSPHARGP